MRKDTGAQVVVDRNGVLRSWRWQPHYEAGIDRDVCFPPRATRAMAKLPKPDDVAYLMEGKARWLHVVGCVSCFDDELHRLGG